MANFIKWTEIAGINTNDLIKRATDRIIRKIDAISDDIIAHKDVKLIFICGPSGSGKTTFANMLEDKLDGEGYESHTLSLDDFFKNREELPYIKDNLRDFDSIHSIDTDLVKKCFTELLSRNMSYVPRYDFIKGVREDNVRLLKINSNDVVIVEGIHSFHTLIQGDIERKHLINIYLEPVTELIYDDGTPLKGKDLRLIRRIIRDLYTRGHSIDATIRQWRYVRQSEDINIYPFINNADYTIDTFAEYEIMVYKELLYPYLKLDGEKYAYLMKYFNEIPSLSPRVVPDNSIIKEFSKF